MTHDDELLENQKKILANQEVIKENQVKLDLLLASQESIIANQETIRDEHLKIDLLLANNDRMLDGHATLDEMIGASSGFKEALDLALSVAQTDTAVLIRGETGTGKELLAHAIHSHSSRRRRPFITVNCAALPAGLVESELFGHEKGAFTGALQRRPGKFEVADGGAIFLDEIGEVPLETQGKFLRILQRQEFERVGSTNTLRVNVRVIAATNQPLENLVAAKKFRADLFYRLNVFPITLPPLRERAEDIPLLVDHFAKKFRARFKKRITSVSEDSLKAMKNYHWPGNIRELKHVIERAALISESEILTVKLPEIAIGPVHTFDATSFPARPAILHEENNAMVTLAENEKRYIEKVLAAANGRISGANGAAEILGLPASTLRSRMRKLGIK